MLFAVSPAGEVRVAVPPPVVEGAAQERHVSAVQATSAEQLGSFDGVSATPVEPASCGLR